jgi:hypothetical protein
MTAQIINRVKSLSLVAMGLASVSFAETRFCLNLASALFSPSEAFDFEMIRKNAARGLLRFSPSKTDAISADVQQMAWAELINVVSRTRASNVWANGLNLNGAEVPYLPIVVILKPGQDAAAFRSEWSQALNELYPNMSTYRFGHVGDRPFGQFDWDPLRADGPNAGLVVYVDDIAIAPTLEALQKLQRKTVYAGLKVPELEASRNSHEWSAKSLQKLLSPPPTSRLYPYPFEVTARIPGPTSERVLDVTVFVPHNTDQRDVRLPPLFGEHDGLRIGSVSTKRIPLEDFGSLANQKAMQEFQVTMSKSERAELVDRQLTRTVYFVFNNLGENEHRTGQDIYHHLKAYSHQLIARDHNDSPKISVEHFKILAPGRNETQHRRTVIKATIVLKKAYPQYTGGADKMGYTPFKSIVDSLLGGSRSDQGALLYYGPKLPDEVSIVE